MKWSCWQPRDEWMTIDQAPQLHTDTPCDNIEVLLILLFLTKIISLISSSVRRLQLVCEILLRTIPSYWEVITQTIVFDFDNDWVALFTESYSFRVIISASSNKGQGLERTWLGDTTELS